MKPKFDKRREGETLREYLERHRALPDDPLNRGITDEEAIADGTQKKPEDYTGEGMIITFGRWSARGKRKQPARRKR